VKHAALYLEAVFEQWAARSGHPWTLDITVLERGYGIRNAPAGPSQAIGDPDVGPD
jgi:hypothetical protein